MFDARRAQRILELLPTVNACGFPIDEVRSSRAAPGDCDENPRLSLRCGRPGREGHAVAPFKRAQVIPDPNEGIGDSRKVLR